MDRWLSIVLVLGSWASAAPAWVLEDCPPSQVAEQREYEAAVRAAKAPSSLYLPYPFPQKDDELLADLEYSFLQIWQGTSRQKIPADDARLLRFLEGRPLALRQTKVEDWTYIRCGASIGKGPLHLIEVTDDQGLAIGRVAVHGSGHWAGAFFDSQETSTTRSDHHRDALEPAAGPAAAWGAVLGATPTDAQWVATHGTVRCSILAPCLAFRAKGESYIVQDGALFRLELEGPRMRTHEVLTFQPVPESIQAIRRQVVPGQRHLVTVGFDRVVFAQRVAP